MPIGAESRKTLTQIARIALFDWRLFRNYAHAHFVGAVRFNKVN